MDAMRFESVNFPGLFIRHRNSAGELTPPDGLVEDFAFTLVNRGPGRQVAFRSRNFPALFLRHRDFRVFLEGPGDNPAQFRADSTFQIVQPGLSGAPNSMSFRSANFPSRFLRHRDFHLWVEEPGADQAGFAADATFRFAPAPVLIDHGTELNPVDG